jgi:hypothetical protein
MFGLVFAMTAPAVAHGEEDLLTDRPDFTETSFVIGSGRVQMEGGFTRTESDASTFAAPELLIRIGLTSRLELRLGAPDVIRFDRSGRTQLGDSYLGAKIQLGPPGAPYGLALIPALSLPTGGDLVTSDRVDPEIVLTWSRDLNEVWSLGGIVGYADGEDSDTTFPTVALGRSFGERWGVFLEWAASFVDGEDEHIAHHGYTYSLGPNAQLDVHAGVGLTEAADDFFIAGGFAIRR